MKRRVSPGVASRAAAEWKRAEAERKAIADAQKIVVIWKARQAGGRVVTTRRSEQPSRRLVLLPRLGS
jgi:hypothetical protein